MKKHLVRTYVWSVILVLIMLIPFLWGVVLSFKSNQDIFTAPFSLPKTFDLSLYVQTFKIADLGTLFKNSLIVSTITSVIELLVIYLSSFSIGRLTEKHTKMTNFFYYFFLLTMAIPIYVLLLPYYNVTMALGHLTNGFLGLDSIYGLCLQYIAGGIPFCTLVYVGAMRDFPKELEEAALIDGGGLFDVMFRIDLPVLMPVVVTLFIFAFLGAWNEFPIASIELNHSQSYTIALAMSQFKMQYTNDYGGMMRAVVMILIPQAIFYFIFQRQIVEGLATTGIKG